MTKRWKLEEAKAKFSSLVEQAMRGEPQLVTKRGQDAVMVVSVQEYERMNGHRSALDVLAPLRGFGDIEFERIQGTAREVEF